MFKVVLIGRPNVGKSTLFNFLVGKNIAIVNPTPGVTRDRKEHKASLYDIEMSLIDTGGYDDLNNNINEKIWQQAQVAIKDANCILFILDGKYGLSPVDKELALLLRRQQKPVIVCVNKSDTKEARSNTLAFYELGFENIVHISSAHGSGMNDLYYLLQPYYNFYQTTNENNTEETPQLSIAFIGKPNVGKSTLVNTLLQEERLITNNQAGTTRDSIYLDYFYNNTKIKLVDTAGLRRRSAVEEKLEKLANADTITAINFATVVVLIISAEEGLTKQDLTLAQHVVKEGRGLIIAVNKIDLIEKPKTFLNEIADQIEHTFYQIKKPYIIGFSALYNKNTNSILNAALELYQKWQFTINTSKLNRWLQKIVTINPPPSIKGRRLKIKFAHQSKIRPPTITIWSNYDQEFPESYLRYIQNELFKNFDLWGCTIRINIKKSTNPYENKPRLNKREKEVKNKKITRLSKKNKII